MRRFLDWMASGRAVVLGASVVVAAAVLLLLFAGSCDRRKVSHSYKPVPGFAHGIHTTIRHCTQSEFLLWSLLALGVVVIGTSTKLRFIRRRNEMSRNIFPKEWFDAAKEHPLTRRIAEVNDFYDEKVRTREEVLTVGVGFSIWALTISFLYIVFSLTGVFSD